MSDEVQTGRLIPYLVEMFRYQAMIALGKIANPMTQEVEQELPAARAAIDLLNELEARTEGHRSRDESRMLQGALTDLRLNYLDEMKKSQAGKAASESAEGGADPAAGGAGDPETKGQVENS